MASQTLRTLKLSLLADVSDFGKGMGQAGNDFQKFSRNVEAASRVATGVIGAVGAIGVSAVQAASDLSETSSAVEQVFGRRSAAQLQTFAASAAQALGQSRQDALAAAQNFGIFGQSAGLAGSELVTFTTDLVTLASDLASFNNTSVDQAINALGAALRGEAEPIRTYGVLLDAATLQARAFADGLIAAENEALDPATRVLAAYNEILEQTTLQQGDFARTSDGLANSQRVLQAELENFRVELGEQLLPVVEELLPVFRGFIDDLTSIPPEDLVKLGEGILKVSAAIVALNTALKVFATLRSAWLLLAANPVIAGVAGAAAATVYGVQNAPPGFAGAGAAIPGDLGIGAAERRRRLAEQAAQAPVGQRQTGNVQVNVTGVVGSVYQVQREIERQLEAASRNRLTVPGRPQ
jgi:hypothetical protein